jgi:adenylate cyclase
VIQPKITAKFGSIQNADWKIRTGCGIASGEAFLVRGGVRRSSSDLVSVGVAPNLAAKLSDIRDHPYNIRIGKGTYGDLTNNCIVSSGKNMWQGTYPLEMGGKSYEYYRTSYRWKL